MVTHTLRTWLHTIRVNIKKPRLWLRNRIEIQLAKRACINTRACVIAITGSSGKSTTTRLLGHILSGIGKTQVIVGDPYKRNNIRALAGVQPDSDFVVCELSIGIPGYLKFMLDLLRPDIGLITFVGIEHHGHYRFRETVAAVKSQVVQVLPPSGIALLNSDDDLVREMKKVTKARTVYFGSDDKAKYKVVSSNSGFPNYLKIEARWPGGSIWLETPFVAEHYSLSVIAAFAAATELGVPVDLVRQRIASFQPILDRVQPFETKDGPIFLLDTIKAPWQTLPLAFATVRNAKVTRKRIVLGTISDYPGNPKPKYRDAYRDARTASDQVIFVGDNAHRSKASAEDQANERFIKFVTVEQVSDYLKNHADQDDLILLKGSAYQHLERIALAWDHDVRCWKDKCGLRISCFECGLFDEPFEKHAGLRRAKRRRQRRKRMLDVLKLRGD